MFSITHCQTWFHLIKMDRNVKILTCVLSHIQKMSAEHPFLNWKGYFITRNLFPRSLIWFWFKLWIVGYNKSNHFVDVNVNIGSVYSIHKIQCWWGGGSGITETTFWRVWSQFYLSTISVESYQELLHH